MVREICFSDILWSMADNKVIQVRARGTVTLPKRFRERYGLEEGDALSAIDLDGALVLIPRVGIVPKLAAEIERLADEEGVALDDLIAGVHEERKRYYAERRKRGA